MKTEFTLPSLNWYPKPENADFTKAIRSVSSKYDKIKEAISILIDNYYKDSQDFKLRESQRVSKIFLKNNLSNLKEILSDDTTIEDFVSALDISLKSLKLADNSEKEMIRDYIIKRVEKILKEESKDKDKNPPVIAVSTLEENKEKFKENLFKENALAFAPHIKQINTSIKTNSAILSGISMNMSAFNLKLKGISLKLGLIKTKNFILAGIAGTANIIKNVVVGTGKAIWGGLKWIGTTIYAGLLKIWDGFKRVFSFVFNLVGKVLVGLITGAISLISNIFGLFFQGILLILKGIFFVFTLAVKAVVFAIGIIAKLTFFLVKGVFVITAAILKGTAKLIEKTMSLGKKIIIGFFKMIPFLLLSEKGSFFLGMIVGFVWKFVVKPMADAISKFSGWYENTKKKINDFINGEDGENPDNPDESKKTLVDRVIESIQNSKLYQDIVEWIKPIVKFSEDMFDNIIDGMFEMAEAIKNLPKELMYGAAAAGTTVAGAYLGGAIGMYLGGQYVLGASIGTVFGLLVGSLFESRKQAKFEKVENKYETMMAGGYMPSVFTSPSKLRNVSWTPSVKNRNLIQEATTQGEKKSPFSSEMDFRTMQRQMNEVLKESTIENISTIGRQFTSYARQLQSGTRFRRNHKLSEPLGEFSMESTREELLENIGGMLEGLGSDKERKDTLNFIFNEIKSSLVKTFSNDEFLKSHIEQYHWEALDQTTKGDLADQIYSLYLYSMYLMAAQAVTQRYLNQFSYLSEDKFNELFKDDQFGELKLLYAFYHNNSLLDNLTADSFHSFYSNTLAGKKMDNDISESHAKKIGEQGLIENVFLLSQQHARAGAFSTWLNTILKNTPTENMLIRNINYLFGNFENPFITKEMLSSNRHDAWFKDNFRTLENTFEQWFTENNITDPEIKKLFISQILLNIWNSTNKNYENFFNLLFDSNRIEKELTNIFSKLGDFSKISNAVEEDYGDNSNAFARIQELNKENQANLEEAFFMLVNKISEDNELDTNEEAKLRRFKEIFTEERYNKLLKRLRKIVKKEGDEAPQVLVDIIQLDNEKSQSSDDTLREKPNDEE